MSCFQARWQDSCLCSGMTQCVLMPASPMVKADTGEGLAGLRKVKYLQSTTPFPFHLFSKSDIQMGRKSAELGNRKENSSFSSPYPSFRSNLWSWASRIYYLKSRLPTALSDCMIDQIISFMPSVHNLWLLAD